MEGRDDPLYVSPLDSGGTEPAGEKGPFDEIEMYLKKAKEDIFIAVNSTLHHYNQNQSTEETYWEVSNNNNNNNKPSSRDNLPDKLSHKDFSFDKEIPEIPEISKFGQKGFKYERGGSFRGSYSSSTFKDSHLQDWSEDLLKDFQDIVKDEIKSLTSPHSNSVSDLSIINNNTHNINGNSGALSNGKVLNNSDCQKCCEANTWRNTNRVSFGEDSTMGANQTTIKVGGSLGNDYYPYKTYTLPRINQRNLSLVGERVHGSGEPSSSNESCKLISITPHRFSRSLSLDENCCLSPWALEQLQLIDEIKAPLQVHTLSTPASSIKVCEKNRKKGISRKENTDLLAENVQFESTASTKRRSNSLTSEDILFINESDLAKLQLKLKGSEGVYPSCRTDQFANYRASSPLTEKALATQVDEELPYADEDSCSLTDCIPNESIDMVNLEVKMTGENVITNPHISITSSNSTITEGNRDSEECASYVSTDSTLKKSDIKKISGRKSEPTYPSSMHPPSPLLGLPGLEVRRHTIPSPQNKRFLNGSNLSVDVQESLVFNTSSWDTLPPAEEMVVMEDKPIEAKKICNESLEIASLKSETPEEVSLSSSLSSLSRLSLQEDFSENEFDSLSNSQSLDSENMLEGKDLSPDVFIDPLEIHSKSHDKHVNSQAKPDIDDGYQSKNSLSNVFVNTEPVIIKLIPKDVDSNQSPDDRKIFHETRSSLLNRLDNLGSFEIRSEQHNSTSEVSEDFENDQPDYTVSCEPITGVLQIKPILQSSNSNQLIFSVTVPQNYIPSDHNVKCDNELNSCAATLAANDNINNNLDRRKIENDISNNKSVSEVENATTSKCNCSVHVRDESLYEPDSDNHLDNLENKSGKAETPKQEREVSENIVKSNNVLSSTDRLLSKRQERNIKSQSFHSQEYKADAQIFLQDVETRISSSGSRAFPNSPQRALYSKTLPSVLSYSGDISAPLSYAPVNDVSTQTSRTPTPASGSPTLSFTWMSDYAYDGVSLEPCASSVDLTGTEEDLEVDDDGANYEEDWWITEGSLSSSPPETPVSPTRDDSSLSLSESLDNLDQNVESGIGTVSTRPSTSPRVNSGPLDFSGSNLSSEDTGLETSFERRARKYLPNVRNGKSGDLPVYYRRRRTKGKQPDCWIRKENQTTQTDPQFPSSPLSDGPEMSRQIRASSEEYRHIGKNYSGQENQVVRETHSEPRLSNFSNPNLNLRVVTSEVIFPPMSMAYQSHSRSFWSNSPLPTLSEGQCVTKSHFERPRNLSLGEVHMPSKAISAPLLERGLRYPRNALDLTPSDDSPMEIPSVPKRTQSAKEISEIEALEACKWLRAAGFPQYAQMYEDLQFPLDLPSVERDHLFLDSDSLLALFRRLRILNRCAKIRLDATKRTNGEDSDDDEQQCALSGNWTFESDSRRWSRIDPTQLQIGHTKQGDNRVPCETDTVPCISDGSDEVSGGHFKRSGSERLKSGAKALLRRMESLKTKKQRRHRDGIIISSPKVLDEAVMQGRIKELGCVDVSPEVSPRASSKGGATDPEVPKSDLYLVRSYRQVFSGEDSSSLASDQSQNSQNSTPRFRSRRRKRFWRKGLTIGDPTGVQDYMAGSALAFSDSECSPPTGRHCLLTDANSNGGKINPLAAEPRHSPSPDSLLDRSRNNLRHSSSLNYGTESHTIRENLISNYKGCSKTSVDAPVLRGGRTDHHQEDSTRHSIYDNVPLVICNRSYHDYQSEGTDVDMATQEGSGSSECTMESRESPLFGNQDEENENRTVNRIPIERWHSFNRKSPALSIYGRIGTHISGFSVGQMNHLRKRALLKLTALMERFCPSNRSTWNWELPKFIRKIKSPDYKDRVVFGVPLQVVNQRTGFPLPQDIQAALAYLRVNCLDQVGLFRKPGVRSRIQKLRELHESSDGHDMSYDIFGPCDIADMVKTYFRELPEVLLTNKLSEIFITICQYLPTEVRVEALQCVMLMLPDENREVLMTLLTFLSDVAANSALNQMTASNLAVCMAPSLFHLNVGSSGSSPLRRKTPGGTPEQKDLHDNKAAHQCLTLMIQQVSNLLSVPAEMLSNCRFSFLDMSLPVSLEDLGSPTPPASSWGSSCDPQGYAGRGGHWIAYMNACIESLLKETKEKSRGWVHVSHPDPLVEVAYRKVGDGHPLRLWKITTDVEAPPTELLNRVLRERHFWDENLLKWRVVGRLTRQAEVFQYMCNSMAPRPPVDFCVLRCWKADLAKGVCVVVETSVDHSEAPLLGGSIRGVVLASRYVIQPCGSGKSRLTHISRVDMRGRLPEWYNKNYAFYIANHVVKLRLSFQHFARGPESKV